MRRTSEATKRHDAETTQLAEHHLARNEPDLALATLLPILDRRAREGDGGCALAAKLLRGRSAETAAPDALATALDRLVRLVQRQEDQIRALRALIEAEL